MNKFYRIKSVMFQKKALVLRGEKEQKNRNIHESITNLKLPIRADLQSSILVANIDNSKRVLFV